MEPLHLRAERVKWAKKEKRTERGRRCLLLLCSNRRVSRRAFFRKVIQKNMNDGTFDNLGLFVGLNSSPFQKYLGRYQD